MTTTNFKTSESAYAAVAKLRSNEHTPYSAMIEVADRCNEVCVHCYQVQGQKGEMSTEEVFSVMDQLADMGVIFLTISGGEATLRFDFLELVEYARKLRFAVKLYTNGLRVDDAMADRLAELAVQEVQISLYSPRPEVHDWVTRVPGSHERSIAAARRLLARGVHVVLKSPVMSFNADDRGAYIALVEEIGADYMLDTHVDPREDGNRDPELLRVSYEQELEIKHDPAMHAQQEREQVLREPALDRSLCGACSGMVHVEANGELQPCTMMTVPVGHALDEGGIKAAWDTNPEAIFLRHLTYGDLHGCRDCTLQPYCHRCHANALTQQKNALKPYAIACAKARLEYETAHQVAPRIEGEDVSKGPYLWRGDHVFETAPDRFTEDDERRYAEHAWLRKEAAGAAPGSNSSGLVQIRRPGSSKSEPLVWPGQDARSNLRAAKKKSILAELNQVATRHDTTSK